THLASLLTDSPVLIGHRKDKLPIGRNFHSVLINKDGRPWVKSYFYWLKSADGAESLKENIDGGIYKECSIGFTYFFPECSVCGEDIRRCDHQPLQKIINGGAESVIHFNYRKIERVLETSLVYRGALPDTRVTKEFNLSDSRGASPLIIDSEIENSAKISFRLEKPANTDNARISFVDGGVFIQLLIRQFNFNRLIHGARFLAEYSETPEFMSSPTSSSAGINIVCKGEITKVSGNDRQFILELNGAIGGKFVLRPVKLDGETKFLFYMLQNQGDSTARLQPKNHFKKFTYGIAGETCL
ncbi:MAG: hypothetical protein ACREBV_09025, partial [Candidatus Zixiibacteriota bacterium]